MGMYTATSQSSSSHIVQKSTHFMCETGNELKRRKQSVSGWGGGGGGALFGEAVKLLRHGHTAAIGGGWKCCGCMVHVSHSYSSGHS